MPQQTSRVGYAGMGCGALALLLAVVHFWAGPFAPKPSLEQTVGEKAVAIRDAAVAALKGEKVEEPESTGDWDADRVVQLLGSVLGATLIVLLTHTLSAFRDYQGLAIGLILLAVILFEPMGLRGRWLRIKAYFLAWPF